MKSNVRVFSRSNGSSTPASKTSHLTKRQKRFVQDCLSSGQAFQELRKKHRISHDRLARWFGEPRFTEYVGQMSRCLAQQREMIVSIGAVHGAGILQETAQGGPKDGDNRKRSARCWAAQAMIRLGREFEAQQQRRSRSRRPKQPQRSLAHPDNSPEENLRLLEALEGRQASD